MNKELLKEQNCLFNFGPIVSDYGRKIKDSYDKDLLILVMNGKNIYLKRYYG